LVRAKPKRGAAKMLRQIDLDLSPNFVTYKMFFYLFNTQELIDKVTLKIKVYDASRSKVLYEHVEKVPFAPSLIVLSGKEVCFTSILFF